MVKRDIGLLEKSIKYKDDKGVTRFEKVIIEIPCSVRRPSKEHATFREDSLGPNFTVKAILICSPEIEIEPGLKIVIRGREYTLGRSYVYSYHQEVALS